MAIDEPLHRIDSALVEICRSILNEGLSEQQWAEREASDWFQTECYCGGYDATESAFTFSLDREGRE